MTNKIIFLLSLLLIVEKSMANSVNGSLSGKVLDMMSKQPIPGVNLVVLNTSLGASTNLDGEYVIENIPIGTYQIRASVIGYNSVVKSDIVISSSRPARVDFELVETSVELEGVTVTSDYFQRNPLEVISVASLSFEEIRRAPGGVEDVIRALAILPGVAQADAGRNDLIVRGGAPSENLYIVDGFVVPNINHFGSQGATGGPLSFINLDYISEISFSTGGFPSTYGDKLSSVLKIDLRESRKDKIGGKATISASQFGLNIEGPVSKISNFFFSARRSYLDWIFKSAGFSFVPEYYDVLGKFTYNIDSRNSLSYLYVGAFDNVRFFNKTSDQLYENSRILGSNQIQYLTGISYRHLLNNGLWNINLSRTFYDFDTSQRDTTLNYIFLNKSREGENNLSSDIILKLSSSSEINFGGNVKFIRFKGQVKLPNFVSSFDDTLNISELNSNENFWKAGFFTNYSDLFFRKLRVNLGFRVDYFNAIGEKFVLSPRFSTSYLLNELSEINLSIGIYNQTPSYLWLIASDKNRELKNIRAEQLVLGFGQRLRYDINLKVEGYYKNYKNYPTSTTRDYLVLANTGAGFAGSDDNFSSFGLEPLVSEGKGFSRGFELLLQKKASEIPHYGILSLTYSETYFTALDGIKRRGSYDQKWIFNVSAGYYFNEKWEASMKFRYSTGKPYTPFNAEGKQSVENYNSKRLPDNHSLDLRIDRRWNFEKWTLIVYLDIQNVYNRKNVSFVRWDTKEKKVIESRSIGILPSIGISAEL